MFASQLPLIDITNRQLPLNVKNQNENYLQSLTKSPPKIRRHDPYKWKCLSEDDCIDSIFFFDPLPSTLPATSKIMPCGKDEQTSTSPQRVDVCHVVVRFKCHRSLFSSHVLLEKGQYVVVNGDRGIDIGAVVCVHDNASMQVAEHSRPVGNFIRYATQREVDYWATDLKEAEANAIQICQRRINFYGINMSVLQCEYQYDKKKLTFYYEASQRVHFVQLLKELYREFGCRIWMEKAPLRE